MQEVVIFGKCLQLHITYFNAFSSFASEFLIFYCYNIYFNKVLLESNIT